MAYSTRHLFTVLFTEGRVFPPKCSNWPLCMGPCIWKLLDIVIQKRSSIRHIMCASLLPWKLVYQQPHLKMVCVVCSKINLNLGSVITLITPTCTPTWHPNSFCRSQEVRSLLGALSHKYILFSRHTKHVWVQCLFSRKFRKVRIWNTVKYFLALATRKKKIHPEGLVFFH